MTGEKGKLTLVPDEVTGDPDLDRRVLEAKAGSAQVKVAEVIADLTGHYISQVQERDERIEELEAEVAKLSMDYKEIESKLGVDPLTGVLNQKGFNRALEREYERAKRSLEKSETGFAVVFFDLDDFHGYNEQYGHLQGNLALKTFVDIVEKNTRKTDVVARWGGEEIAVILPNADEKEAVNYVNKVLGTLKEHAVKPYDPSKESELKKRGTYLRRNEEDTGRKYNELSATAGVFVLTNDSNIKSGEEALNCADIAERQAKMENKGGFLVYSPSKSGKK
ncbi:GGDEF domain-containing protein [Candidatus Woesearchaeota archaeon]|nr:GGDEF domain-containing protein [Candidatus Woesearchaeota archaeon]